MVDYLIHFYKKGGRPFRSLSALPETEAFSIMKYLYIEGSIFWERFKDPYNYLSYREQVEQKLRNDFIEKGGVPKERYPI